MKDLNVTAMEIIAFAGDASVSGGKAVECLKKKEFTASQDALDDAAAFIAKAHNAQTEIIQEALKNGISEYSLLFSHAQDTLMTIESELRIYQVLLDLEKVREEKR